MVKACGAKCTANRPITVSSAYSGLCGIVAHAKGAIVTLTDQNEMVDLLKKNASVNCASDLDRIHAHEFDWATDVSLLAWSSAQAGDVSAPYDCILVSDCVNPIYGEQSILDLAQSIQVPLLPASCSWRTTTARAVPTAPLPQN